MPNNTFAPQFPFHFTVRGTFIVKNIITNSNKTIKIFNYPIPKGTTRDLLRIPGIGEGEIRTSLLKGEIRNKILANEIEIIASDIDLMQFNTSQKNFITKAGIQTGHQIAFNNLDVRHLEDEHLLGNVNSGNTIFKVAHPPFIQDNVYKIIVLWNGIRQLLNDDYLIIESGGAGTGFDTVILAIPPDPGDVMSANYYTYQF